MKIEESYQLWYCKIFAAYETVKRGKRKFGAVSVSIALKRALRQACRATGAVLFPHSNALRAATICYRYRKTINTSDTTEFEINSM